MKLHTSIFFPIEIIGTIAFASSGAMVAFEKTGSVRYYCTRRHYCCGRRYAP